MCEQHNSMLAHCWPQIDFVSILANFFASYCYVVHTRQLLANICFSCEKCFKASLIVSNFAYCYGWHFGKTMKTMRLLFAVRNCEITFGSSRIVSANYR